MIWPATAIIAWRSRSWDTFMAVVRADRPVSLAVSSRLLPPALRFGFNGANQVGIGWDGRVVLANPLAPDGSRPQPVEEEALKLAATALYAGEIRAALFPARLEAADMLTELVTQAEFTEFLTLPGYKKLA